MAADKGAGKVVVMSAINVDHDPGRQLSRFTGDRDTEVERAVAGSGPPWAAARPATPGDS